MNAKQENKYVAILNQLRNGESIKQTLESILAATSSEESRVNFLRANILGVFRFKNISEQLLDNSILVLGIKLNLCKDLGYVRVIAFENEVLQESLNFIFYKTLTQPNSQGISLPLSNLSSEFMNHPNLVFKELAYHLLILYELGKNSSDVISEISKYNILPKLLFIIEKGPNVTAVNDFTLKKCAQKLLNLILTYVEVANFVCIRLELFKWVLRITKLDLYKAKDTEMMETLSLLSFSDEFLPKIDEDLIIGEWVFGTLVQILIEEKRTTYFEELNKGVNENGFLKLLSYLAQILGNVSKSQGGMEEIISAMEAYSVDIVWRIHYMLLKFNISEFYVWYTVLYLTNNILRIASITYAVISNISNVLVTIACRAFRYLEFTQDHKAMLCAITISRNVQKITREWNIYFENKKKPWETLNSPSQTPEEIQTRQERIAYKFIQQFKQYKLFFKKLPNSCEFCQDFYGPPFFPEDAFWKVYSPENEKVSTEIEMHTPIVLLQFLSDLTESENNNFLLNNVIFGLNSILVIGEGKVEERIKCGIITLYMVWSELRQGFSNLYLVTGLIVYHQYYTNLMLQGIMQDAPAGVTCKWDSSENVFKLVQSKPSGSSQELNQWRLHLIFHLLELLRSVLRVAPETSNNLLKTQCIGLINLSYFLVTSLYENGTAESKLKALITTVISTTEEVTYRIIRRLPGLFYVISDSIESNPKLLKIYIDMTGFLPNLLSTYTHITTFYLFISKDKTSKLAEKIVKEYLESFIQVIFKVLTNLCAVIEEIETSKKSQNLEIDKSITEYLEKIIIVKCAYYILLSLLHCFEIDQFSVNKISTLTYIRIYERLKKVTKFSELNFMNKSIYDYSYNFPEGFHNNEIKMIPGSRNYIVIDFEEECEDDLFRYYITSIFTTIWYLSLTEALCLEVIVDPATRELFRIAYYYERWNIQSYMAICSVTFNFCVMHTHSVLNCLPLTISIIVKYISELRIPIEGYLLLFQAIREIYPKVIAPAIIHQIQQIIAPLRTILSAELPMLKYFNYPLLKEKIPFNKKIITVAEEKSVKLLEDETSMKTYFPKQLLKVLPIEKNEKFENYPGQAILQSEAKSLIKMVTPITHEGVLKTRQKIQMHVKAGEGDLLIYQPVNSSREERMSLLFTGLGSHIINSHYSILESDVLKNKRSVAKLDEGFNRLMIKEFEEKHNIKF